MSEKRLLTDEQRAALEASHLEVHELGYAAYIYHDDAYVVYRKDGRHEVGTKDSANAIPLMVVLQVASALGVAHPGFAAVPIDNATTKRGR